MSGLAYFLWLLGDDDVSRPHIGDVCEEVQAVLKTHILPNLTALSAEAYTSGPASMLLTAARSSYILYGDDVLWCTEWSPGLIAVRFSPDGAMAWTALRSPIPGFAGRDPLAEDLADCPDEDDNPLYTLIFDAWDAEHGFDEYYLKRINARPASEAALTKYNAAMAAANDLPFGPPAHDTPEGEAWRAACYKRIADFAGEGLRYWRK